MITAVFLKTIPPFFIKPVSNFFLIIKPQFSFLDQSLFAKVLRSTRLLTILIFLFIFLLPFAPETDYQIETFSYTQTLSEVNHRQFGVTLITLSNLVLIPLSIKFLLALKKESLHFYRYEVYLFCFILVSLISALNSISYSSSFVWFLKLFYCVFTYFLFSRIRTTGRLLIFISFTFLGMGVLQGLISYIQFLTGNFIGLPFEFIRAYFPNKIQEPYLRVIGTFAHPNKLSAIMAMLLPFSFIILLKSSSRKVKYLLLPMFFLSIPLIALSRWGFATALFSFVAVLLLIHLYIYKFSKKIIYSQLNYFILFLLLLMVLVLNPFIYERFTNLSLGGDTSYNGRIFLVGYSLTMIKENPWLGIGPGSFTTYFSNFDYSDIKMSTHFLAPVHNFLLLTASENGITALLFFCLFCAGIFSLFIKKIRTLKRESRILAVIFAVSALTFLFNGLWELRTLTDRTAILFFIILGLLVNILRSPVSKFS